MRALVLSDWRRMTVDEVAEPTVTSDEALLEILATGICGSDIHGFTGENGRRHPGQIMGHEFVARVIAFGSGSPSDDGITVGDVVTVNPVMTCGRCAACLRGHERDCVERVVLGVEASIPAAFAQRMSAPVRNLVLLPEGMPIEHGALVEPLAVGYHAAMRGGCAPDDRLLIIGGGPIGQACVLAARRLGITRIVVSEPNPLRRDLIAQLGAAVMDPGRGEVAGAATDLLGGVPDRVIDAVGTNDTLRVALTASSPGSTIVLVGMNSPSVQFGAYDVSVAERTIVGSFCYTADEFRATTAWAATSARELGLLVDARRDLDAAPASFVELADDSGTAGKILVFPNGIAAGMGEAGPSAAVAS